MVVKENFEISTYPLSRECSAFELHDHKIGARGWNRTIGKCDRELFRRLLPLHGTLLMPYLVTALPLSYTRINFHTYLNLPNVSSYITKWYVSDCRFLGQPSTHYCAFYSFVWRFPLRNPKWWTRRESNPHTSLAKRTVPQPVNGGLYWIRTNIYSIALAQKWSPV